MKVSGYLMPGVATNTTRRTDIASSVVAHSTPVAETKREGDGAGVGVEGRGGEREGKKKGRCKYLGQIQTCVCRGKPSQFLAHDLRAPFKLVRGAPVPPGGAFSLRATFCLSDSAQCAS